jgi:hypothetical protein
MAQTKVKLISDGVIVQSNLHSSHGITTAHIGEGSNLYYTDARVGSYLSTNSFATESYVGTQITNLVDSSPATLNTLNELAAALGDDPNFATTTATSIGTKLPLAGGTLTGGLTGTTATFTGKVLLDANVNFESSYSGNGLVLSHHSVGPSNAIVSGNSVYPDTLFINNGGSASDWSNVSITGNILTDTVQISSGVSYNENIRMFPGSNDYSSIILGAVSGTSGTGVGQWSLVRYPSATHSNKFSIRHNTVDAMVITKEGRVGIGTASPNGNLQFSNAVETRKIVLYEGANNDYEFYGFGIEASTLVYSTFTTNDDHVFFAGTGSGSRNELMRIGGDGNVGIGTTSPDAKLEVAGGSTGIRLSNVGDSGAYDSVEMTYNGYNSGTPEMKFRPTQTPGSGIVNSYFRFINSNGSSTTANNKANVTIDGNVGINQTSPSFKLDVNGTGYFSDLLRVDEPVYSYTNSGTKHYTHLATGSLYGSGASAAIITTNIPGHNISGNGNMFSFKIVGYAYTMGIIDMTVGMYAGENNYYSAYWSGTCQDNWIGNVYVFTNSAGAVCIQLGEVTDALNCEIAVTDFVQGFGNVNANYSKGWSIAAVTTLPTQNQKTTLNYKTILPDVYEDVTFHDKVGIGTTSPTSQLFVNNTADGDKIRWGRSDALVGSVGTYNGVPYIGYQGGGGGGMMFNGLSIEPTALGSARSSNTNDIGSASYKWKDAYLGGGVYLGGTAATNKLDDYEEGTFTPRLQAQSGGHPTHSIQAGFYTKIGNVVTCVGTYTWSNNGSNANTTTKLEGFPFVNSSTTNARAVGSLGAVNGIAQGATLRLVIDPGHAGPYIIQQNSNNYSHNNTISASGAIYGFSITYRTS